MEGRGGWAGTQQLTLPGDSAKWAASKPRISSSTSTSDEKKKTTTNDNDHDQKKKKETININPFYWFLF